MTPPLSPSVPPEMSADCAKLADIRKECRKTQEEFITVTLLEGKTHENALRRMELCQAEVRRILAQCETEQAPSIAPAKPGGTGQ